MQRIKNAVNETAIKSTQIARMFNIDHESVMITIRNIRESLPASYHADLELRTNKDESKSYWLVSWTLFSDYFEGVINNVQSEMIKRAA